jgi:replication factor C subunit 2/4
MNWVEKYRPTTLNEICDQENIINSLKKTIITKNIPHLIFHGPSGCGKTSTILALAQEIFKENYLERIIELNASDERGINIIRDKIKKNAKQSVNTNQESPPWKIIILDEADTMTIDSQFALRKIIDEYSKLTRFCIICNYNNKIIEPIISRCSSFRFNSINNNYIFNKLKYIMSEEKLNLSDVILNKIINISNNDLRKAINLLQKCNNTHNHKNKTIKYILNELSGYISNIDTIIKYAFNKDIYNCEKLINKFFRNGYSLIIQIKPIHNYIINMDLSCKKKANIIDIIIDIEQKLITGCDEYILFMKLIYFIMNIENN